MSEAIFTLSHENIKLTTNLNFIMIENVVIIDTDKYLRS